MKEITFNKIVDAEALHQELKAALGDAFIGVSVTGQDIIVHLQDTIPDAHLNLGLTNTTTRLTHLYGDGHEFESGPREEGGYAVRITIPFKLGHLSPPKSGTPLDTLAATVDA